MVCRLVRVGRRGKDYMNAGSDKDCEWGGGELHQSDTKKTADSSRERNLFKTWQQWHYLLTGQGVATSRTELPSVDVMTQKRKERNMMSTDSIRLRFHHKFYVAAGSKSFSLRCQHVLTLNKRISRLSIIPTWHRRLCALLWWVNHV